VKRREGIERGLLAYSLIRVQQKLTQPKFSRFSNPKRRSFRVSGWSIFTVLTALLLTSPLVVIAGSWLTPEAKIWQHLAATVLWGYSRNSLLLAVGVGLGTTLVGVSTAWLVTMCRFPGRRLLEWALLLPMAFPAYILAYTYTDVLQVSGPVQSFIRDTFALRPREYWFPDVRSLPGAIVMLTLALYPYVYLLARTAFLEGSTLLLEAAQSLRCNAWSSFFRVSLPLARPAIAGGVALAVMEALSDFGTVDYFGVPTLTTGIYRTWFGMGERAAAAQLASCLLVFVLVVIGLERRSRRRFEHSSRGSRRTSLLTYPLTGLRALAASFVTTLPVLFGFLLPSLLLVQMALATHRPLESSFWQQARNSVTLAGLTAFLAVTLSVLLAYAVRVRPNRVNRLGLRLATIGYAIPGSVIAVSTLIAFGWLDTQLSQLKSFSFILLSGTLVGLLYAYLVRFLATSFNGVEAQLKTITMSMDNAAKSLGYRSLAALRRIHLPLLRPSLLAAFLFVFVEVVKELPATLIVRPFNLDTLAVRVYRLAADERLREAAPGALAIVLVSLLPVILLSVGIGRSRQRS
jgi:iron(III) transport system permease protein